MIEYKIWLVVDSKHSGKLGRQTVSVSDFARQTKKYLPPPDFERKNFGNIFHRPIFFPIFFVVRFCPSKCPCQCLSLPAVFCPFRFSTLIPGGTKSGQFDDRAWSLLIILERTKLNNSTKPDFFKFC